MKTFARRFFCFVAGIDHGTILICPSTDRIWASHLGFMLLVSFTVVFGITFHATGYMLSDVSARLGVSCIVALTIFMFDRALYQSDWFQQTRVNDFKKSAWNFVRITIRLVISVGVAYILSLFLELALFSDMISEKLKLDHIAANQQAYQTMERYETQLNGELEGYRRTIAELDLLYRRELVEDNSLDPALQTRLDTYEQQLKTLEKTQGELRAELREVEGQIVRYEEDMNAEQHAQVLRPQHSGRRGRGPKFLFAQEQKKLYETKKRDLERQIEEVGLKRRELLENQARLSAEIVMRRNENRNSAETKRNEMKARLDSLRDELTKAEGLRVEKIDIFRSSALKASSFQKLKDDPLARMTAYSELKNDPKHGATISLFSFMCKLFIIFLEVIPVLAKMFFSPLVSYGQIIRTEVESRIRAKVEESSREEDEISKKRLDGALDAKIREIVATSLKSDDMQAQTS